MTKVTTQGDENFSNSQEEVQKFVQEQKSEITVKQTSTDMKCFYRFLGEINKTNYKLRFCCTTRRPRSKSSSVVHEGAPWQNEIGEFLKTAADEASLERQRPNVNNHIVRKTNIGRLFDANTTETFVAQLRGQKIFKASNHTSQQMSTISDRCRIS